MFDVAYENLTSIGQLESYFLNETPAVIGCKYGWTYDTSQYKSSIVMDVRVYANVRG